MSVWSSDAAILIYLAAATILAQLLCGGRYGFHRDELATLDDARHLAWGYVAYPPLTPFFGRLSLTLFGTSLSGFRFFAAVAQAVAVVLTGLMARELGGGRGAQLVAAAAAVPFCLASGALMQYVAFDYLCWVLDGLLRSSSAQVGRPALVARHRRQHRSRHDDEIHHGLFCHWHCRRRSADENPPPSRQQMALAWRCLVASGFSAQHHLASPAPLHLARFSAPYPRARCPRSAAPKTSCPTN